MATGKLTKTDCDVSDIIESGTEAWNVPAIHGKVVELSPVRISRKNKDMKYFEGRMSDGKSCCWFVSFDVKAKDDIEAITKKGESVLMKNCDVKKSRVRADEWEIVMSQKSTVMNSPKKFKVDEGDLKVATNATVQQLERLDGIENLAANCGNQVGIRGHIISVQKKEVKSRDKVLQMEECMISDQKDKAFRLVLWEKSCGCLNEGKSYTISSVGVRAYQGVKYFSMSEDCEVKEIDRIADEVCDKVDNRDKNRKVVGEISGIMSFVEFVACSMCDAKVCEMKNGIGQCNKCGLKQKMSKCHQSTSARLVIQEQGKTVKHNVSMFSSMIAKIVQHYDEVNGVDDALDTEEKLLFLYASV